MPGPFTLAQIASRLGGRVAGDPETLIRQVGSLERADRGQIAFLSSPKYRASSPAPAPRPSILRREAEALTALPRIVCDEPYAYFARVSQLFNPRITPGRRASIPSASVAPGARLGGARVDRGGLRGRRRRRDRRRQLPVSRRGGLSRLPHRRARHRPFRRRDRRRRLRHRQRKAAAGSRFRRSARSRSATTSRSAPTPPSTAARWTTR